MGPSACNIATNSCAYIQAQRGTSPARYTPSGLPFHLSSRATLTSTSHPVHISRSRRLAEPVREREHRGSDAGACRFVLACSLLSLLVSGLMSQIPLPSAPHVSRAPSVPSLAG